MGPLEPDIVKTGFHATLESILAPPNPRGTFEAPYWATGASGSGNRQNELPRHIGVDFGAPQPRGTVGVGGVWVGGSWEQTRPKMNF